MIVRDKRESGHVAIIFTKLRIDFCNWIKGEKIILA